MTTILLVDENEPNRYAFRRVLETEGYTVHEAGSGQEALRLWRHEPDLVILDVSLPDVSGWELCRRFKREVSYVPVLLVSARFLTSAGRSRGLESGADGYLSQPVEPDELLATVRALLRIRQAEAEARRTVREWQTTFDAMSDGVVLVDLAGRIRRSNRAMTEMVGLGRDELWGRHLEELLKGNGDSHELLGVLGSEEAASAEVALWDRWFRITTDPVSDEEGRRTGSVHTFADITKRKEAEAESLRLQKKLRQYAAELARKDRLKTQFLANVSHEVRTPMTGIIGLVQVLERSDLEPEQQEHLATIRSCSAALLRILDDILDLSKIESGVITMEARDFDIIRLVDDCLTVLSEKAAGGGIALQSRVDEDVPRWVRGDSDRLRQLVVNLVNNALKFTEEGSVTVALEQVTEGLRVSVTDTGIGIPESYQESIFEPFTQVDESYSRTYGGTGLGLAICRRLVEQMGGVIGVSSRVGEGSTFWFVVPLEVGEPVEAEESVELSARAGEDRAARILVAEDNPINRRVTVMQLRQLGYRPESVSNGLEALEAVKASRFDLVLMDCQMPQMDGYEAAHRIREDVPADLQPVIIALTAHAMIGEREKCLAVGMNDYLSKPFEFDHLRSVLERHLRSRQPAS